MLVLTRRVGEKLIIGDNVTVTILGVKGSQVRIGIDAPSDVTVNREEIYQRILNERGALNGNNGVRIPAPKTQIPVRMVKNPARTLSLSDKRLES